MNLKIVQKALARAEQVQGGAWGKFPKLDAIVSVLRAEARDRLAGIIGPDEQTDGLKLARRVRVVS